MPAWRPDGRAIIAAVAPHDETFNLHEFAIDGSLRRQLTHTGGGATWPDVSPDGKMLVFVGYTPEGDDVFSMPYPRSHDETDPSVKEEEDVVQAFRPAATSRPPASTQATAPNPESRPTTTYEPLSMLSPTSWTPMV